LPGVLQEKRYSRTTAQAGANSLIASPAWALSFEPPRRCVPALSAEAVALLVMAISLVILLFYHTLGLLQGLLED
jgi:hypothetical protein